MTKPANFPERIRQRQIGALERLEKAKWPNKDGGLSAAEWRAQKDSQVRMLTESIFIAGSQRGVRTKIYRGAGREYERAQ